MKSLGFVARASLRESGLNTRANVNPIHMIALEAAERAYAETYALLEAEQEGKWKRRAITAAKIAGAAGGGALVGLGALSTGKSLYAGRGLADSLRSGGVAMMNPLKYAKGYYAAAKKKGGKMIDKYYHGKPTTRVRRERPIAGDAAADAGVNEYAVRTRGTGQSGMWRNDDGSFSTKTSKRNPSRMR